MGTTAKEIFAIAFVGFVLIMFAQYGSNKYALVIAGIILLSSLILNINKIKGVFQ